MPRTNFGDAAAIIVRRPAAGKTSDLILVHEGTSPDDLARAASVLLSARRSLGDSISREMRTTIQAAPAGSRTQPVSAKSRARAVRDLDLLARAATDDIRGFGKGPSVSVIP